MLTNNQIEEYIQSEGDHCPYCKSKNIEGEITKSADYYDGYEQEIRCNDCKKTWTDVYTLTSIAEHEE
jgi:transposase-like protein